LSGSVLHFVWVDDAAGDCDIYYASSEMMPVAPLSGTNVVDDTSGADQTGPAIIVTDDIDGGSRVFACWRDLRNVTASGGDVDLYFVEIEAGAETNILVGDDGTGSDQSTPALGVDMYGYPYVIWADDRNASTEIYYAASTFMDPYVVDSQTVAASIGRTVGVAPAAGLDDVSVEIPAGASPHDATVTITKIQNPPLVWSLEAIGYDFGPSGLQFGEPVTITIPYLVADFGDNLPSPCWYDSQTGTLSQQGITNIETLEISDLIHALRFRTTHFTPYYLADSPVVVGSGGGGGGCSLSPPPGQSEPLGYFVPFALLAAIMIALRHRDIRRHS